MEFEEFYKELKEKAKKIDLNLEKSIIDDFFLYMNELILWNEKINLTAITEPKEIIIKHFIDSLTILKYIKFDDNLLDIGTGAGFPRNSAKNSK